MGRPNFPIEEAYLVGGWLESFFWGLFSMLFWMTLYGIYKKRREGVNKFTTISIIVLYLLATGHISLGLTRLIQGFVIYRDTIGPELFLANIDTHVNIAKDYLYITSLAVGDAIVSWRLYVVWGKKLWVTILPILMIIGELITGYGSISQWFLPHPKAVVIAHWGNGLFVFSLVTNIVVTTAIATRIWYMTSRTRQLLHVESTDHYNRVIFLIVESGALITAAKLVEYTLFKMAPLNGLIGLNALYVVYELMPQITGLAPTVIVYAVNSGFTKQDSYYTTNGAKSTLVFGSRTIGTISDEDASTQPATLGASFTAGSDKHLGTDSSAGALEMGERKMQLAWKAPSPFPLDENISPV